MYSLEWLNRVYENVEERLYGRCGLLDKLLEDDVLKFELDETPKHPVIKVSLDIEEFDNELVALAIHFDPFNQEFYLVVPDEEYEIRVVIKDTEQLLDHIHSAVHETFEKIGEELFGEEGNATVPTFFDAFFSVLDEIIEHVEGLNEEDVDCDCHEHDGDCEKCDCEGCDCECSCECKDDDCDCCEHEPEVEKFNFNPEDIEWISEETVAFEHPDEKESFHVAYQLGKVSDDLVLARKEIVTVDGEAEEQTVHLLFFHEDEVGSILDVLHGLEGLE